MKVTAKIPRPQLYCRGQRILLQYITIGENQQPQDGAAN
jgi:hypothetical protein